MGVNAFLRLKVGIGRPPKGMEPAEYVLKAFEEDDQPEIDSALCRAAEALVVILSEGVEAAMNRFQKKPNLPGGKENFSEAGQKCPDARRPKS